MVCDALLSLTAVLLLGLGIGRGLVAHTNLALTTLETLGVVAMAAGAGALIGTLLGVSAS